MTGVPTLGAFDEPPEAKGNWQEFGSSYIGKDGLLTFGIENFESLNGRCNFKSKAADANT